MCFNALRNKSGNWKKIYWSGRHKIIGYFFYENMQNYTSGIGYETYFKTV